MNCAMHEPSTSPSTGRLPYPQFLKLTLHLYYHVTECSFYAIFVQTLYTSKSRLQGGLEPQIQAVHALFYILIKTTQTGEELHLMYAQFCVKFLLILQSAASKASINLCRSIKTRAIFKTATPHPTVQRTHASNLSTLRCSENFVYGWPYRKRGAETNSVARHLKTGLCDTPHWILKYSHRGTLVLPHWKGISDRPHTHYTKTKASTLNKG